MQHSPVSPRKIAIIGAGFSGVALAAALRRQAKGQSVEIYLFEKTKEFGAGDAYRTPFTYHLLNARVNDMSALEDESSHFLDWLKKQKNINDLLDGGQPLARQFVPRILYRQYLNDLLAEVEGDTESGIRLTRVQAEVTDLKQDGSGVMLTLNDGSQITADQAVLAFGNNPPSAFPFPVSEDIHCIHNPWDYAAVNNIPADEPVLIMGTGLSMVDAVLSLYHQKHLAKIYSVSRRGLLPLPHTESEMCSEFDCSQLPGAIGPMMKDVRMACLEMDAEGGDWRAVIHNMRCDLQSLWQRLDSKSRKRFLRHVLPYWNIHRHRIHEKLYALLMDLQNKGQLEVLAGRVREVGNGIATVKVRKSEQLRQLPVKHIINCMGSGADLAVKEQPLLKSMLAQGLITLDGLRLGLATDENFALKTASGTVSPNCYTIGPPMRGELWECIAVPEIRKHCKQLAGILLS